VKRGKGLFWWKELQVQRPSGRTLTCERAWEEAREVEHREKRKAWPVVRLAT
jgi:hypothetical protein